MRYLIFILIISTFLSPFYTFAQADNSVCSSEGYTVLTINGMYTDEAKAIQNKDNLKKSLPPTYNNEKISLDYLHNPSHIAGLGDVFAVSYQKFFENENVSDYDLVEMWNDASQKVKTKKVLLVSHSQGNFYANSLFNEVSGLNIGERKRIPLRSIGIYGVATPASYVAGNDSKYITSSTDEVINKVRTAGILNVLPPNMNIKLPIGNNSNGHSFSDVYLKYEGTRIVTEIKSSLDRLSSSILQNENEPCIAPPEPSFSHKTMGIVLAVADPTAIVIKKSTVAVATGTYNVGQAITNGYLNLIEGAGRILANAVDSLRGNSASVILADDESSDKTNNTTIISLQPKESQPTVQENFPEITITKAKTTEETPPYVPQQTSAPTPVSITPIASVNSSAYGSSGGGGPAAANLVAASVTPDPAPAVPDPVPDPEPEVPAPIPDIVAPIISITGDNPISVEGGIAYTDAGATAEDDIDGEITSVASGTVDTAVLGTYTVTYTATDAAGNITTTTRTVNIVDTTPPVISIVGNNPFNTFVGANYNDLGATAMDSVDGARSVIADGSVDMSTAGTYEIGYTAEDLSGNSVRLARTVNVSTLNTNFPATSNTVSTTLISNTDWTLAGSPYVVTGELQINPGVTLNIEPGVVVKFADANSYILVNNSMIKANGTAADKIYFTSFKDDTTGGDTNADGSASLPTSGDWRGIYITGNNPDYGSSFSNAVIRYAGASSYPALYDRDHAISITDSVITDNGTIGFYKIHNNVNVSITNTEISDHAYGLYLETGILNISNSNIKNNLAYGAYAGQYAAFNGQNNYWGDATGPYNSNLNATGLGNAVTNNISFDPWLTAEP